MGFAQSRSEPQGLVESETLSIIAPNVTMAGGKKSSVLVTIQFGTYARISVGRGVSVLEDSWEESLCLLNLTRSIDNVAFEVFNILDLL